MKCYHCHLIQLSYRLELDFKVNKLKCFPPHPPLLSANFSLTRFVSTKANCFLPDSALEVKNKANSLLMCVAFNIFS